MKIALFGATGTLGAPLLERALGRGHEVTALVRTPAKVSAEDPALTVVAGDVTDATAVARLVAGQDAVVNAVGGAGDIRRVATAAIVAGMRETGCDRLVNLGGAGLLRLGPWPLYRLPVFPKAMVPVTLEHRHVRGLLEDSGLRWTLVCPGFMAPGSSSGGYLARTDRAYLRGGRQLPVTAVAEFILDELEQPSFVGRLVAIRAAH
ncbi:MAG TPA: NAD(P)H-binding protein [Cryptosporangiaceae bacterium]|nr:NAD(P)H-binding protein [Cryptosporangiaceae bacterium]